MKTSLALLALTSTASAGLLTAGYVEANHHSMWESFKRAHGKNYTATEEPARMAVFKGNMLKAAALQVQNPKATFGMNKFSAHTEEEVFPYLNGVGGAPKMQSPAQAPTFSKAELEELSPSVDWREQGAVTEVKNQYGCGSCWTFSTTGAIEGANFLHGDGKLTSLSEMEFVSCGSMDIYDRWGCIGGFPSDAINWAVSSRSGQVVTEEAYPYIIKPDSKKVPSKQKHCPKDIDTRAVGAVVTGQVQIKSDEDQMAAWTVKNGPISVLVYATAGMVQYTGGVMTNCEVEQINHAVLAVGVVVGEYWIIKNSWGADWGEGGYLRVAYGSNQCNITAAPVGPTM